MCLVCLLLLCMVGSFVVTLGCGFGCLIVVCIVCCFGCGSSGVIFFVVFAGFRWFALLL